MVVFIILDPQNCARSLPEHIVLEATIFRNSHLPDVVPPVKDENVIFREQAMDLFRVELEISNAHPANVVLVQMLRKRRVDSILKDEVADVGLGADKLVVDPFSFTVASAHVEH